MKTYVIWSDLVRRILPHSFDMLSIANMSPLRQGIVWGNVAVINKQRSEASGMHQQGWIIFEPHSPRFRSKAPNSNCRSHHAEKEVLGIGSLADRFRYAFWKRYDHFMNKNPTEIIDLLFVTQSRCLKTSGEPRQSAMNLSPWVSEYLASSP